MTLSASGSGNYQWNNGVIDGVAFIQSLSVQTYTVTGVDALGCVSEDQVTISLVSAPIPTFNVSDAISCINPLEVLISNTTIGNIINCSFNFGNGVFGSNCDGALVTFNDVGCYDISLSITDANGCSNISTISDAVCILEQPDASFTAEPAIQDIDLPINFINNSTGANSYNWNFGNNASTNSLNNVNYIYNEEGYFTVTLIAYNELGCADTAFMNVEIKNPLLFFVPNSFTPDGKNYNELFVPIMTSGFDPWDYELSVFNRWGELVFLSQHPEKGWDGKYGGMLCPEGPYIWQIRVRDINGIYEFHRGHVNLIR
jgi:gliding motility-associated-like protein